MAYEIYKESKNKEDYFNSWSDSNVETLTEELKDQIYNKHRIKCKIFQRDKFKCQNADCKFPDSPLTLHHIKFKKNGGEDKVRNGITLCRTCHMGYHKAKRVLTFSNPSTPAHIRGHTFQLVKEEKLDWKQIRADMHVLRKNLKDKHGIQISMNYVAVLLKWLHTPYNEWDD